MELLKELCAVQAPSGDEKPMKDFLLKYIKSNQKKWKPKCRIIEGDELQDGLILVFGKPTTAIFAHMDSIGFTVRYGKQLVKIGGPRTKNGFKLIGADDKGEMECTLKVSPEGFLDYSARRNFETGTTLTFKPNWRETKKYIQCCYMDNRLGVWNALKVAETLENGIICFTCYEEHGGGSAQILGKYIYEKFGVRQALISDISWVTDGVKAGKGAVISLRDSGVPRRSYIKRILEIVKKTDIPFQMEVEDAGGSDGIALQRSSLPFDWCFVGAPEQNVHSPNEKVHKDDIDSMVRLYQHLMKHL